MLGLSLWQPKVPSSGGAFTGILDTLGLSVSVAYSTRRLKSSWTGSLIRIRRSSDNAEQDIGYNGSGDLDTTAIASFVGANSAFITTMYDQSGGGNHLIQSTAASQPRIVNAGVLDTLGTNTKPSPFYGLSQTLIGAAGSPTSIPLTICLIYNPAGLLSSAGIISSGGWILQRDAATTTQLFYAGTNIFSSVPLNVGTTYSTQIVHNGGSSSFRANNTNVAGNAGGLSPPAAFTVGSSGFGGYVPEVIIFPSGLSAANQSTLYTSQSTYWGF